MFVEVITVFSGSRLVLGRCTFFDYESISRVGGIEGMNFVSLM